MQLDRTHVVVRPRSISEICDLATLVLRQYFLPLVIAFGCGMLPFALLNFALLGWIPVETEAEAEELLVEELFVARLRYGFLMASLIFLQTPIAGVFATHYIGQAVFESRPPWRKVLRDAMSISHRWIWILGIVRGPLIAMLLLLWINLEYESAGMETFVMMMAITIAGLIRAVRPHAAEILLLERCPLRAGSSGTLPFRKRSYLMHSPVSGESSARFLAIGLLATGLTAALFLCMMFLQGVFAQRWSQNLVSQLIYIPFAMWSVAGFTIIVRFLCYLDNRIRLEGWDVELSLRAEAARQFEGDTALPAIIEGATS